MAFVRSFAEAIRAAEGTDPVVLALAGPWGSGESSLLNLVAAELEATSPEKQPLVIRFNPWWFSGSGRSVAAFLQQVAAAVSRPAVKETLGGATIGLDHLAEIIAAPGVPVSSADPASRPDFHGRHRSANARGDDTIVADRACRCGLPQHDVRVIL